MNCQEAPSLRGRPRQDREARSLPSFVDRPRWVLFRSGTPFRPAGATRGSSRGHCLIAGAFGDSLSAEPLGGEESRLSELAPLRARVPPRLEATFMIFFTWNSQGDFTATAKRTIVQ